MSTARELAEFLTRITPADLPAQAVDHAAMLIASTLASAAMGRGIQSAAIIRDMAQERGGSAQASLWFDAGPKLPVVERGAGQRGDERRRGLRRQRSAQYRALRHAADRDRAGARRAQRRQRRGRAGRDRARLRTGRAYHRRGAGCAGARVSRLDARDLRGDRGGGAPAAARCRADDARDRLAATSAGGPGEGGRYQRRARVQLRQRDIARHPGGARRHGAAIRARSASSR